MQALIFMFQRWMGFEGVSGPETGNQSPSWAYFPRGTYLLITEDLIYGKSP
jgi:hypothetical protein